MNEWALVFLAVLALATLAMAGVQVALLVVATRLTRRVDELAGRVERDVRPILAHAAAVAADAARASALAVAQVERVDQVMAGLARRADETAAVIQQVLVAPAREGRAVVSAILAIVSAWRELRRAPRRSTDPPDEDDPLFIG